MAGLSSFQEEPWARGTPTGRKCKHLLSGAQRRWFLSVGRWMVIWKIASKSMEMWDRGMRKGIPC